MESVLDFIKEFYALIVAFIGSGAAGGWFLKTLDYNRDKKKRQAHHKAKLLDEILDHCRSLEKTLEQYPFIVADFQRSVDEISDDESNIDGNDPILNLNEYIEHLFEEKEKLKHLHQDYEIKSKSNDLPVLSSIVKNISKMIMYNGFIESSYEEVLDIHKKVLKNLRSIHQEIKDVYPEEVPFE